MPTSEIPLRGSHNVENVLAAIQAAALAGVELPKIREAVATFRAVDHRLQFVANVNGVDFYNDSKATNVDATIKALQSFDCGVRLILGGKDKGSDYTVLAPLLRERAAAVYTIGAAAAKIEQHLANVVPIRHCETLQKALTRATEEARSGDTVLLAPACASFDQFQSYEHRGRVFADLVHAHANA